MYVCKNERCRSLGSLRITHVRERVFLFITFFFPPRCLNFRRKGGKGEKKRVKTYTKRELSCHQKKKKNYKKYQSVELPDERSKHSTKKKMHRHKYALEKRKG